MASAKCGALAVTRDLLELLYLKERKSIPDIALVIGMTKSTTRKRMIAFGIQLRSRKEGIQAAKHKLGVQLKGRKRTFTDEWKSNLSSSIRNSARVKNSRGTRVTSTGYIEYTRGEHKGRSAHVVAMEKHIGRRLLEYEVVHHKDGDKQNNEIENLELMTRSEHTKHHQEKKYGKC